MAAFMKFSAPNINAITSSARAIITVTEVISTAAAVKAATYVFFL